MSLNINNNTKLNTHGNVVRADTNSIQSNETANLISNVHATSQFDLPPLSPGTKSTATPNQLLHNQHFNNLQARNKALGLQLKAANEHRSKFTDSNAAIAALQLENERATLLTQKMAKLIACDLTKNDNSLEVSELIRTFLNLNAQDTIVQYNNELQSLSMIALEKGLYKIANLLIQDDYSKGNYKILHYRSTAESKTVLEELNNILITDPELGEYFTETQEQQHPHKTRYNTEDNDSGTIAGNIASSSAIVDDVQNNINVDWTKEMFDIIIQYPHNNDNPSEVTELTRAFLNLNAQDTLVEYNNKIQSLSMIALEKGLPSAASLLIYDDCMNGNIDLLDHRSSPESNNVVEKLTTMFTQQGVEAFFDRIKDDRQAAISRNNTEDIATTSTEDEDSQLEAHVSTNLSTPPSGRAQEQHYYAGHNINHHRINTNLEFDNEYTDSGDNDANEELLDIDAFLEDLASNDASTEYGDKQFPNPPRDPNRNPLLDAPKKSLAAADSTRSQEAGILLPELHGEHLPMNDGIEA